MNKSTLDFYVIVFIAMVNTFLPFPNVEQSVRCLDNRRLGKQRVEAFQIHKACKNQTLGWRNHPATKMWRGHTKFLRVYLRACCAEWERRGFRNDKMRIHLSTLKQDSTAVPVPPWFGSETFHRSHRANLYYKDPVAYAQFKPDYGDTIGKPTYLWPSP